MLIRFFKSSFPVQYLVIGVTGLALWFSAFLLPPGMPPPEGPVPVYHFLYLLLQPYPFLSTLLGFILVMTQAYWLTNILNRHELVLKNSSLSALVYVVMMSLLPGQLTLTPITIVLGFMILILHHLLISYNRPEHLDRIYAAGFFTALSSLIYLPFILWFVFVIISFLVFRAGNWRAWMAAFLGLFTPFLYLAAWYFWNDRLIGTIPEYSLYFSRLLSFPIPFHSDFWILYGFTLLLALWGVLYFRRGPQRTVEVRAKTSMLLWTLVFTLLSFIYAGSMAIFHPTLATPALAMVITGNLVSLKKTRIAEWVIIVYLLSVLLNNHIIHRFLYR